MYTDVNLEALKRCDANNAKARRFNLGDFIHHDLCGTYGCLVGNDWLAVNQNSLDSPRSLFAWARREYGISLLIAKWLFDSHDPQHVKGRGINCYKEWNGIGFCADERRPLEDIDAALGRLRKYAAYIERKRAMLHEPDGRIKESARKQEGNWMVCPQVSQSLALAS